MGSCIRSLIYLLYFIVGFFFWCSIYKLLEQKTQNPSIHQYIIIGGYFFVEIFTGLVKCCDKVEKSPEEAISDLSSLDDHIQKDKTNAVDLFGNDNQTIMNQTAKPFIGIKKISFIIPALFDTLSKILLINGMIIIEFHFSLLQPVIGLLFSVLGSFFFKKSNTKIINLFWQTAIGALITLGGLSFTIVIYYIKHELNFNVRGFIMIIAGEILKIGQYLFQNSYCSSETGTKAYIEVCFEGIFGTLLSGIIITSLSFIGCPSKFNEICNGNNIESFNSILTFVQGNNILPYLIILLVTSFLYNILGVLTIQKTNIINRQTIEACFLIPLLSILLITTKEEIIVFNVLYIPSLCVMLFGALVTCEIVRFPFNPKRNDSIDESIHKINPKDAFLQNF